MRLLLFSALAGFSSAMSNVTYWGAPRLTIGDTLPNTDSHGHLFSVNPNFKAETPSCGNDSRSADVCSIAYYQVWNVRTRPCDKVWPSQIDTTGLTHLNLAFASIDPNTFMIRLQNEADDDVYREFTKLKSKGIQAWLGVGGWEFSDEGNTHTTWSDLSASRENRKSFISSTVEFLSKYGFQGLDVDWEWPSAANHGGRPDDRKNQVALMKELREGFGKTYGLSCVLPQDAGFLSGIDLVGLALYVDFFNVLTYDIHGIWDEKIPELGNKIHPHTDMKEIDEKLNLLCRSGVDLHKFTLGLAYYGRGYTAADPNCLYQGCEFGGPSLAGSCSKQVGMLSNCEIKRLIKEKNLRPIIIENGTNAVQISWDNQWLSYDSPETIVRKKQLANNRCMGGTSIWASTTTLAMEPVNLHNHLKARLLLL